MLLVDLWMTKKDLLEMMTNLSSHPLHLLDHLLRLPHLPLGARAELLLGVHHVRHVVPHSASQLFKLPARVSTVNK